MDLEPGGIVPADAATAAGARTPLTLERLVAGPALLGTAPSHPTWSPDSRWLAFLWNHQALPAREIWLVGENAGAPRRLTHAPADGERNAGGVSDLVWTPESDALLYLRDRAIWHVAAPCGTARRLTSPGGDKSKLGLSPDGRLISYLEDGDLWFLPRDGGVALRATTVGVPPIGTIPLGTYFRHDVEIGGATWGGASPVYAWSPDGRYVAVHHVDRRGVRTTSVPYYLGGAPVMNLLRRGNPGDANETRTVGLYDVQAGTLRLLDLPESTDARVVSFSWSSSGTLLIDQESDDAVDRRLYLADPRTHTVAQIWHDHRETRIYNDIDSAWHSDGEHVLLSGDLEDHYQIYLLTPGSAAPPTPITSGPFDVTGAGIPVAATSNILYVSSEPSPYERHVWRTDDQGAGRTRLTTRPGVHTPFLSPDGRTLALLSTDDVTPPELYLTDATVAGTPRRITASQPAEFATQPWVAARYVSFGHKSEDLTLHARIIEPPDLDRTKTYPVIFGPMYSNTVRNRWETRFGGLQQYLVIERGYIVVQVDVRGSTGYGRDFREKFLMDWGGRDLDDIESAVDYLKTLPYVDGERMGIWGTSYGGTLTVYSLLKKPGLFRAGVAAAPAIDPLFFGSDDVAICRRPQTHSEAFTRGALQYAANLRDHLLIIHGMQDDVVPFQTSVALAEELMRLGKDFDFAFAPAATHAWSQRQDYALYLMRKLVDHFDRYLMPPGCA